MFSSTDMWQGGAGLGENTGCQTGGEGVAAQVCLAKGNPEGSCPHHCAKLGNCESWHLPTLTAVPDVNSGTLQGQPLLTAPYRSRHALTTAAERQLCHACVMLQ